MKLCRFISVRNRLGPAEQISVGLITGDGFVLDLTEGGWPSLTDLLEKEDVVELLRSVQQEGLPRYELPGLRLLAPLEYQEVWAVGVTYLRSRAARMEESQHSASAYDRVYDAERPELFFKAPAHKVAGPGDPVGKRRDSSSTVPEPELALVFNSRGAYVACTIGNDMSARDIEGENLLYLPQAKVYDGSCALGPWLVVGADEQEVRSWKIQVEIQRDGKSVFSGETELARLKRSFEEMKQFLFRCQTFSYGAVLLTGTGIVPPDDFCLQPGDLVRLGISGIG
jgi:2-dehydro-3-deoxy-D-arabinonate dehydratase